MSLTISLEDGTVIDPTQCYGVIYKITHIPSQRVYVGQYKTCTRSFHKTTLYMGSGSHIRNAIKKYGTENFTKTYLQACSSAEELDAAEISWIAKLNCRYPNGFNLGAGGERNGKYVEAGIRKKMSASRKQFLAEHPTYVADWSKYRKDLHYHHPETTRQKQSLSAKKSWQSSDRRAAVEQGHYKHHFSDQQRAELSHQRSVRSRQKDYVRLVKDQVETKVARADLDQYLQQGWTIGRAPFSQATKDKMSKAAKASAYKHAEKRVGCKKLVKYIGQYYHYVFADAALVDSYRQQGYVDYQHPSDLAGKTSVNKLNKIERSTIQDQLYHKMDTN